MRRRRNNFNTRAVAAGPRSTRFWFRNSAFARLVHGQTRRVLYRSTVADAPVARPFAADAAAAAVTPAGTSLAKLLASHILRDGEIVLLILRPSLWFVLLSAIQFVFVALMLTLSVRFLNIQSHAAARSLVECGVSAISARLAWATLQWMSRLYILTDRRIISLTGVFQMQLFDCPLRKVVRTRLTRTAIERATGTGSIEIVPQDETSAFGEWKTIAHPFNIHEQILATITRAKQGSTGCD